MYILLGALICIVFIDAATASMPAQSGASLVVAMLARDEEALLRRHLPEWQGLADAFVVGVDDRTLDRSDAAALEVLGPKPLHSYRFEFTGFGPAKSELLRQVHVNFPNMDYVLIVEPDMLPVAKTFDRSALQGGELVYSIRRSGKESRGVRLADSIFRNDGGWRFEFRVHESPVYRSPVPGGSGVPDNVKDSGWGVVEIEGSVRDSQSRTIKLQDELRLVELDLKDFSSHPRLLYYAGVLRYELATEFLQTPKDSAATDVPPDGAVHDKVQKLARKAVKLLQRRARDPGNKAAGSASQEHEQQRTAAAYFCARSHQDLLGDHRLAEQWYRRAIALEPDFLYSHVALIHLLFKGQRYEEALKTAVSWETGAKPRLRLFMDSMPLDACDMPLLLSKAIYFNYITPELQSNLLVTSVWKRRTKLLEKSSIGCPAHAGESQDRKMNDIQQLQTYWKSELEQNQL